jgi:hypothetical protein
MYVKDSTEKFRYIDQINREKLSFKTLADIHKSLTITFSEEIFKDEVFIRD